MVTAASRPVRVIARRYLTGIGRSLVVMAVGVIGLRTSNNQCSVAPLFQLCQFSSPSLSLSSPIAGSHHLRGLARTPKIATV